MSYFGGVKLHALPRGPLIEEMGTYMGVAPEFTAVLYRPGDLVGIACALASLAPMAILIAHLTLFLSRREWRDLWFAGGQVVCEVVNGVIKVWIKQPRPSAPVSNMPVDSYGMPSAHAQFMGFVAFMVVWGLSVRAYDVSLLERFLRASITVGISLFVAYSRYYLYYHSGPQVLVGLGVGVVLGAFWTAVGETLERNGFVDWFLGLWPCRILCIKNDDYSVRQEYDEWVKRKESMRNKKTI